MAMALLSMPKLQELCRKFMLEKYYVVQPVLQFLRYSENYGWTA